MHSVHIGSIFWYFKRVVYCVGYADKIWDLIGFIRQARDWNLQNHSQFIGAVGRLRWVSPNSRVSERGCVVCVCVRAWNDSIKQDRMVG